MKTLVAGRCWPFLLISLSVSLSFLCGCAHRRPGSVKLTSGLEYAKVEGKSLRLDIYEPKNATGKLPALVWIHGGSWNRGSRKFCPIAFMATQNLAIVSIDYRLAPAAQFPAPLYDCKAAIRWLRANAHKFNLDTDHIGIFGASAGGHLALLMATTMKNEKMEGDVGDNLNFSSRIQCVCAFYPPTDLNRLVSDPASRQDPKGDVAKLLGGPVAENEQKADLASPIFYVDKNCAPIFLMHGGADALVPPQQSEQFYRALIKAGVEAHLEIIPDKGHGIIAPPLIADEIYKFFQMHLNNVK